VNPLTFDLPEAPREIREARGYLFIRGMMVVFAGFGAALPFLEPAKTFTDVVTTGVLSAILIVGGAAIFRFFGNRKRLIENGRAVSFRQVGLSIEYEVDGRVFRGRLGHPRQGALAVVIDPAHPEIWAPVEESEVKRAARVDEDPLQLALARFAYARRGDSRWAALGPGLEAGDVPSLEEAQRFLEDLDECVRLYGLALRFPEHQAKACRALPRWAEARAVLRRRLTLGFGLGMPLALMPILALLMISLGDPWYFGPAIGGAIPLLVAPLFAVLVARN
jgi:hypothetical protein